MHSWLLSAAWRSQTVQRYQYDWTRRSSPKLHIGTDQRRSCPQPVRKWWIYYTHSNYHALVLRHQFCNTEHNKSCGVECLLYLKVHAFTTVGDNTQQSQGLGQILGSLCLPCSCRSSRSSSKFHRQCLGQCEVDTICQGCDHKTSVETHVFITIAKLPSALADDELIRFLFPVKSQLAFPFEFPCIQDTEMGLDMVDQIDMHWIIIKLCDLQVSATILWATRLTG